MTGFSLADHLFNRETLGVLAAQVAQGVPGFDPERFVERALAGFPERALLERMEWMADCIEPSLSGDFNTMAGQLEAALPPALDPDLTDDDFGHFINAVPGILAVRHGLGKADRPRAMDLLHKATQRFSMEYYIRPFLNAWPEETLAQLALWADDPNYHVRRLVSEGTRPRLPWAKAVTVGTDQTLPLLARLHGDKTRYVTRSVSNHLNDIAKKEPDRVVEVLKDWQGQGRQSAKELNWMTKHALRTLVKQGHSGAMDHLGYRGDVAVDCALTVSPEVRINEALRLEAHLTAPQDLPLLVDYVIWFQKADGSQAPKVFKLKEVKAKAGIPLILSKNHRLKGDATTFKLYPGAHRLGLQINGRIVAEAPFQLLPPD